MGINDRIRKVRTTLKLTQKQFGQKLAIAQSYLTNIETGKREVTEKILKLICLQFNVNEEWLRTGNGEMFVENNDSLLAQLAKQYNLDDFSRRFIETYIKLPEQQREIIKDFAYEIVSSKPQTNDIENTEMETEPYCSSEPHQLTDEEIKEIDAECEEYRRELEAETFPERFPANRDNSQKNA